LVSGFSSKVLEHKAKIKPFKNYHHQHSTTTPERLQAIQKLSIITTITTTVSPRGTQVEKNWREGNFLATIFGLQEMRPAGYSSVDLPFLVINSLGE